MLLLPHLSAAHAAEERCPLCERLHAREAVRPAECDCGLPLVTGWEQFTRTCNRCHALAGDD